jgi:hypothetical protein
VVRVTRRHHYNGQVVLTRVDGTKQVDPVAVIAIDDCQIKLSAPCANNLKRIIDIARDEDRCGAFQEVFLQQLFKFVVSRKQKNMASTHCFSS